MSTDRDALLQRENCKQFQVCYRNKKWDDEKESKQELPQNLGPEKLEGPSSENGECVGGEEPGD